ncbi:branched-chain amino acid ABC transporter permease [Chelatococcus asaccharovorans]|uniref:Amino acid/amide ABC transporter membrane protein 2 (HAAT family) n=1 Tax=Chelatococcus asaccharovorans TaxID=28210 RepID=A0A2V3UHV6_9HYPH|nr:branched-chain amino acid ABC transporter permease [Chelatococcus asaccharovorans]MBS7706631.1 branched-chain amino acid ABC transporter permease [Chelatococcus asaccharovorans]PXW64719.1 amino acid/amide ABC transporter membrane protein 2 (HAAT family) [Chelatococcus asaccharovorans]
MKPLLVLVVAAAAMPLLLPGEFYLAIATQVLVYGLFAVSVNLIAGYCGMVSLGHAAFLGISGYAFALLSVGAGWPIWAATTAALGLTSLTGAMFGLVALRTSGLSFLMITLALGQIVWGIAFRYVDLTNGENGISLPRPDGVLLHGTGLYYLCLAVTAGCMLFVTVLTRSPLGAAMQGVRDQPRRMSTLGYDVWAIRYVSYVLSALLAAASGILYMLTFRFISPHALSLTVSSEAVLMVIAGGLGTTFGPLLGAALVVLLKNVASAYTDRWPTLLGLIFLFIIVVVPEGLLPGARRLLGALKARVVAPDNIGANLTRASRIEGARQ